MMKMAVKIPPNAVERKVVAYLGYPSGRVYFPNYYISPDGHIGPDNSFHLASKYPSCYQPIYEGELHIEITG